MHQCNARCHGDIHYEIAYTIRPDITATEYRDVLIQAYGKAQEPLEVLEVKELLEFDEMVARENPRRYGTLTREGTYLPFAAWLPGTLRAFGFYCRDLRERP